MTDDALVSPNSIAAKGAEGPREDQRPIGADSVPAMPQRQFAVGCLPIEFSTPRPATEWPKVVERELYAISAVSNVSVTGQFDWLSPGQPPSALAEELSKRDNEREEFWPEPMFGRVAFDVVVPLRLQSDLTWDGTTAEHESFRVVTMYGYEGPCTFISLLNTDGEITTADSTNSVAVVHSFISKELEKNKSGLRMARVGPSPFHIDATLTAMELDKPFHVEELGRRGYRRLDFRYDRSTFDSIDDAERALQRSIAGELALFYFLIRVRNRRTDRAHSLLDATNELVAAQQRTGIVAWLKRVFFSASKTRRLGLEVLSAKLLATSEADTAARRIEQEQAQTVSLSAFTSELAEASADDTSPVVENAEQVVAFSEKFRSAEFEVSVVATSTILGAVAGAIVALVVPN
ncbi:hypothetical protein [Curtobacterium sp. MCSS17_008]|uniref:hypothetical protein n=1 Tax=Curtobacterium sp. MCSS17_008 TaxID=2175647 RepID=UPI0011B402DC|nr:hypothetical protein [Curtobacterium sp. MCSS17_008]